MLEHLLGNKTAERVLLYLANYELKALLEKALAALPAEEVRRHYRARRRPRRAGKPLWSE